MRRVMTPRCISITSGLDTSTDVKVPDGLIFQAAPQADAFAFGVFLDLALSDEVFGELVGQSETHHDGQFLMVEGLLKTEADGIENVGAQGQFVGDMRLYAQLEGKRAEFAVVVANLEHEVVNLSIV